MAAFGLSPVAELDSSSEGSFYGRSMFVSSASDLQSSSPYRSLDGPMDDEQEGRPASGTGRWIPEWIRLPWSRAESQQGNQAGGDFECGREPQFDDMDDDEEEEGFFCGCFEPLSTSERLLGWLTCFLGSLVLSAVSIGSFNDMLMGRNNKFAVTYSIANFIGLAGTSFLVGPSQQARNMVDSSRLLPSFMFLCSLFLTLLFSAYVRVAILIVCCVAIQWLSYLWYSLSYIPYGREGASWLFSRVAYIG